MTEAKRICWACTKPLDSNQQKCLECDSWQNWRSWLNLSTTTLALIVAIISSTTTLLPLLTGIWPTPPKFTIFGETKTRELNPNIVAEFTVRNYGDIAGFAQSGFVCQQNEAVATFELFSDRYLAPKEISVLKYSYYPIENYRPILADSIAKSEGRKPGQKIDFELPSSCTLTLFGDGLGRLETQSFEIVLNRPIKFFKRVIH